MQIPQFQHAEFNQHFPHYIQASKQQPDVDWGESVGIIDDDDKKEQKDENIRDIDNITEQTHTPNNSQQLETIENIYHEDISSPYSQDSAVEQQFDISQYQFDSNMRINSNNSLRPEQNHPNFNSQDNNPEKAIDDEGLDNPKL
ncbi:MAG: hypothetical protein EZS28_023067 [Streblomastix strix]|uniref:Uncharacterized protein n=1 Tax=Streblomastix strix TaxID=222440 RepID=A0A5J4VFR0_9EUKA|nr:MAG: hypothetical protein EZS28_023067 [Streblomastix strix]